MADLHGKTLFITGASRGIGEAIALRAARDGANIAVAAKTDSPNPKLPGTIHTAAQAIEKAGGKALALRVDIRDEEAVAAAVARAAEHFGGIDILVNNASAIYLARTADTPIKRLDLMFDVNMRGSFVCAQACLPFLRRASNPHILSLAPPPNLDPRWFREHVAYTLSKYGMSLAAFGMAAEFRDYGIAVNTLWPCTVIATAAIAMLGGRVTPAECRKPEIVADAAHAILLRSARECSGRHFTDEKALREAGVTDFERYAVSPGTALAPDLFLD
ncbi:MAG TPA: NAD(P)-dependent oxidoreductase [Gammaproteobacteria bacterium]|nr:NAD(P)-dependent oxidoreductase [Gammaproteobacteria bacterium]